MPDSGGGCAVARHDFSKHDRVRTRPEITRIFGSGLRYSCAGMRLHVLTTGLELNRVVIVPVKSYSGAIARNRAKRVLRECWRLGKRSFKAKGYDVAIVLYPGGDDFATRSHQLNRLLRQAGILDKAQ